MNWKQIITSALGAVLFGVSFIPGLESARDTLQKAALALMALGVPAFVAGAKSSAAPILLLGIGLSASGCSGGQQPSLDDAIRLLQSCAPHQTIADCVKAIAAKRDAGRD